MNLFYKSLSLLAGIAMLFAGCKKENAVIGNADGEQNVTITVGLPDSDTRAVADRDGNAVKANHWIMEVRDAQGELFYKDVKTPAEGTLQQTFTVALIKNQSYSFLFWADNNGGYYNTEDLTNVTLADVTYSGNLDARDAFTACKPYSATTNEKLSVKLYRPFAQVNVITTDLETLWKQAQSTTAPETTYLKFEPINYSAVVKVPTTFNVLTQQCGDATEVTITADETYTGYKSDSVTPEDVNNYKLHTNPATLFMDYLFASKGQKDIVDIAFSYTSNAEDVNYAFTSIPVQANYRTNIKGKLLSYDTEWVVEIIPDWETPDYDVDVFETTIDNIQTLNEVLASDKAAAAKEVTATATMPSDSDAENVKFTSVNNSQVINLNFEGSLGSAKTITFENVAGAEGPSTLNVVAPAGTQLVFNNPMTHVVINGTSYDNISGVFSANSLIVAEGVTVKNLEISEGGLEIHGTVLAASVTGTKKVYVRDCEGLSQEVYNALKDYIVGGYVAKQNGDKWDIVPEDNWINYAASAFLKVDGKDITINSPEQLALLAKNVLEGNSYQGYTIKLGANIDLAGKEWTPVGIYSYRKDCSDKNSTVTVSKPFNGTFDGNGFTVSNMKITVAENGKAYNGAGLIGYMTAGSVKNLTVADPDIEGRLYVGAVAGYPYTGTAVENCHVSGDIKIAASWYCGGVAGNGYIRNIKGCSVVGKAGSYIKGVATKYNDDVAGYFGGIIGFSGENVQVVDNCVVKNIDITAECNGVGGIAGILQYGNTVKNCVLENVNVKIDTDDAEETPKVAFYAGSSTGKENAIGWCINNKATNCTVKTKSGESSNFVGTKGSKCDNPVHVAGYDVEFNKDGKVIAGTFQAIPESVVAENYEIETISGNLYKVVPSNM